MERGQTVNKEAVTYSPNCQVIDLWREKADGETTWEMQITLHDFLKAVRVMRALREDEGITIHTDKIDERVTPDRPYYDQLEKYEARIEAQIDTLRKPVTEGGADWRK